MSNQIFVELWEPRRMEKYLDAKEGKRYLRAMYSKKPKNKYFTEDQTNFIKEKVADLPSHELVIVVYRAPNC